MNTKKSNFQIDKKYFIALSIVIVLNLVSGDFLIHNVLAQKEGNDFKNQKPVKADVLNQESNPLRIMISSVDNTPLDYQEILFSLQNNSNKPIKAYTLLGNGKRGGKIITKFFAAKRFLDGESIISGFDIERSTITEGETILLSVDYVEFEDGSFWGSDSTEKSKEIAGQREGTKAAISKLKDIIAKQNSNNRNNLLDFLRQEMQEIVVEIPDSNQSDFWKKGFRLGYKSVISILKRVDEEENTEKVIEKLNQIEKLAKQGEK